MGKRAARALITVFGVALGVGLVWLLLDKQVSLGLSKLFENIPDWVNSVLYGVFAVLFGIIFFILSPAIINAVARFTRWSERRLNELSMQEIFVGVIGLIIGLIIAVLISLLIAKINIPLVVIFLDVIVFIVLMYLGWRIPTRRVKEINLPNWFNRGEKTRAVTGARPKVLDTSAIIDGRFFDVCNTGIVDGNIIVPAFVLDELRHIADSADSLKRARGRRGLDAITRLQTEENDRIIVVEKDYSDLTEVDTKLLRLAQEMGGIVVTNDYNLGKVAAVQGVPVFNINDLANTLRINVVAGEEIEVTIVKEGKEAQQGVAYFDDGTMIVVEGARKLVGETVPATVTSVLQTSAGKMVFAKVNE